MRAIAPNADLRPFHSSARSASSAATRTLDRAVLVARCRATAATCVGDAAGEPVDLDEQHGLRVARIARADEVLDRGRDARVHHLERGGQHAGRDDPADGRGRVVDASRRRTASSRPRAGRA